MGGAVRGACLTPRAMSQVGFHGVDVDVMVRDLVDVSIAQVKLRKRKEVQKAVDEAVENTILTALMGKDVGDRSTWKTLLRSGQLDNQKIEIDVRASPHMLA
jgi:ATP-dependent HslUV protease ATP-binding subunit HslU